MSSMPSCLAGRGRVSGLDGLPGRPLALIMSALVGAGLVPRSYLLTTHGRKTGRPRTNPVVPVEHGGRRWLVAPYGPVSWVHNARATGRVSLTRRRNTRDYTIREVPPDEAGPVLKRYVRLAPSTRRHFQATKDSPVSDFISEADRHPVFELTSAGEDHQRGHSARVWDKPRLLMKAPNNPFMWKRRSP